MSLSEYVHVILQVLVDPLQNDASSDEVFIPHFRTFPPYPQVSLFFPPYSMQPLLVSLKILHMYLPNHKNTTSERKENLIERQRNKE